MSDIYETFEEHVSRLVAENESLRKRNMQLESRELDSMLSGLSRTRNSVMASLSGAARVSTSFADMTMGDDSLGVLPGDSWAAQSRALEAQSLAMDSNRMSRVVAKLKKVAQEKDVLKKQLEDMHKKDRQHILSNKMVSQSVPILLYFILDDEFCM
jgi:cell division protein FtsB